MKTYLMKIVILLVLIISLSNAKKLEKVSLQLQWLGQFQFAGYYMAKEKGFYKEYGLDVHILPYKINLDIVDNVLKDKATYATGRSSLVIDYAEGKDVVAIAAIFQSSPMMLLVRNDGKINSPEDIRGKRVMMTNNAANTVAIAAMLRSVGVSDDSYTIQKHSFDPFSLERNETDAIASYISNEPYQLDEKNISYKILYPKDYGFDFYSDILFTSLSELKNHPQRVANFKKASLKGWEYAFNHIQETAAYIYRYRNPQNKSLKSLIYEANALKKLACQNDAELGEIKRERLERIEQMYRLMGFIHGKSHILKYFQEDKVLLSEKEKKWLHHHKQISVAIDPYYPPISFINSDGKYAGVNYNYLKLIEQKLGIHFDIIKDRLYSNKISDIDVFSISNRALDIKNIPQYNSYMEIPLVIIAKRDFGYVASLDDIDNTKIVMVKNDIYIQKIKEKFPKLNISFVNNIENAMQMVSTDEFDYFIGSLATTSYLMDLDKFSTLKVVGKIGYSYKLGFVSNNLLLNSIIQKTVKSISKQELDTIYQKWNTTSYEHEYDYTLLWQSLGIFTLLFIIIFYKNRELERTVKEKTKELQNLNNSLNKRIEKAVEEIHFKEHMIIHQAKMASLGETLESIAHQWRQPLNISSLSLAKLEMEYQMGKLDEHAINTTIKQVSQQINYMSDTIDDFRNFFKADKEKVLVKYDEIMKEVETLVKKSLASRDIELHIKFNSSIMIYVYTNELKQVILNVIHNAKDAIMQSDSSVKIVNIEAKIINDMCCLSICDSGGGIDKDNLERIFEPYFTTKFESQGTGIGLYMAKNIIEKNLKGKIVALNGELGACFEIFIPIKKD